MFLNVLNVNQLQMRNTYFQFSGCSRHSIMAPLSGKYVYSYLSFLIKYKNKRSNIQQQCSINTYTTCALLYIFIRMGYSELPNQVNRLMCLIVFLNLDFALIIYLLSRGGIEIRVIYVFPSYFNSWVRPVPSPSPQYSANLRRQSSSH